MQFTSAHNLEHVLYMGLADDVEASMTVLESRCADPDVLYRRNTFDRFQVYVLCGARQRKRFRQIERPNSHVPRLRAGIYVYGR